RPRDPDHLAVWSAFHDRIGFRYEPAWWWTLHTWGTAAAAIHNLVQVSGKWTDTASRVARLQLAEDPIAYLGVLVDIIEDWDRYSVRRGHGLLVYNRPSARMPLQSVDVSLDAAGGRVIFGCPADRVGSLEKDLDLALDGWREILTVASI